MDSLEDINRYINDGDYKRAIEELNLLIYNEPDNAKAFYMRGKFRFIDLQKNKYDYSSANLSLIYSNIEYDLIHSIEIDPNIIDAYRGLMYLNRDIANVDKEREYAQILFEKDNKAYDALLMLANSYLNNGENASDFHQAIGYYDDFIERVDIEESKIARFERGLCYYNLNILIKADYEANELIKDFPFYDEAYFLKAIALAKKGVDSEFYYDALLFLNRAIELNDKNYNAIYERAEWYFSKEDYLNAIKNYDILLETDNKYKLAALLGKSEALHDYIVSGEYHSDTNYIKEAFSLLDKIIKNFSLDKKYMRYKYYRGNLYAYIGEAERAKAEFDDILKNNDDFNEWFYNDILEFYYYNAKTDEDYKHLIKYLDKIKNIRALIYKTFSYYKLKNYKESALSAKEVLGSLDNSYANEEMYHLRYVYAFSLIETKSHDYETIIENLKISLNSTELNKAIIYRKIAKVMIYNIPQKYYYEGIKYLELAINMNDFFAYYIYSKELFYGNILTPSPELAIGMANTSIDLHSTFEPSHIILGRAYELGRGIEKNEDKAFEIYYKSNEIAKMNNYHSSCSKAALAHCYYNGIGVTKNEALALELIKDAVDNYSENCHDYVLLLYAYFALTNKEGFSLEKAASVFDEDITYHNSLSFIMTFKRVYKKLGNSSMVKKLSSIEKETLKNTGEFNLNYLRKYIKNYNEYYPIVFNR
ncbi:tetratricopeptide repeat protein [Brachyspira pilosicoli]|uniref:Tetratricopeptide repeat protein n=1 Tax=Brachyspira pilosicoli TaxID=52584 RepID=A0AAJ6G883_BRAPL|nr:tetratricopeptide repeat protein [Brachyspira pilosicoli]WIH89684.1 tetratricopeptide repeat protein [Brachyspira pilosicoli]WIH91979.1 tetratricopeptide repeat protein [Brachyspira pilosicoli]WIH94208.1 tetratricopeptide repeat protein [Brachyspira pilosicoli]